MMFTRPIIKTGNWARLKRIIDDKITTEIILTAKPNFPLRICNYSIGNLNISLEINEKIILRTSGKILEVNYHPEKLSYNHLMPQQIPSIIVDWINEILRQNDRPKENFLKNSFWTSIIVNYKSNKDIIATAEYPKVSGNFNFDGTVFRI